MSLRGVMDEFSVASPAPQAAWRRIFDILCAIMAALIFAPVITAVALAVWLESGRPILFVQLRLGQGGRPFRIYKFRKFRPDCSRHGHPLTADADSRLTRVGHFLAMTKLDELPQLWNVVRGDMSMVGPRPESLAFTDCFRNGFERVLEHRPGLFGPCQVMFRHESKLYPSDRAPVDFYRQVLFPTKAKIDIDYFSRRTFLSDLGWMLRAAFAIVFGTRSPRQTGEPRSTRTK